MPTHLPLEFHWSTYPDERAPEAAQFPNICRAAELAGFASIRIPEAAGVSELLRLAAAAGNETSAIRFRVGCDFSTALASLRGCELLDAWAALQGRLIVHLVSDGDGQAMGEFIQVLRALFPKAAAPPFEIEGDTAEAAAIAIKYGDCLWRRPHQAHQVYADALPVLHFGKPVGLACQMATLGGSYADIAHAIHEFNRNGISRFLIREERAGQDEMAQFAAHVMPRVWALRSGKSMA